MVYMLPGSAYKEADLQQINEEALKEADVALLADAWEASSCILIPLVFQNISMFSNNCKSMQRLSSRWQLLSIHVSVHTAHKPF